VIVEGDVDGSGVKWIRYQLLGTTLMRGVAQKAGTDPMAATASAMFPFVQNVMNNAGSAQIAQIKAIPAYAGMFPGGNPVPVFQYTCDTPSNGPQPCTLPLAAGYNYPTNIRDVTITLIVMTPQPDAQTGLLRLVELNGRAHRINPVQ
jgi:hypothetical protein